MTAAPLLSVRDLSVAFRQSGHVTLAVDRVSFDVGNGETDQSRCKGLAWPNRHDSLYSPCQLSPPLTSRWLDRAVSYTPE
jgi:hypothetical protein